MISNVARHLAHRALDRHRPGLRIDRARRWLGPRCPRVLLGGLTLALSSASASAQARETRDNASAWFSWFAEVPLGDRWGVDADISFRRSGPLDEWQQILARAGLRFAIAPSVRVGAGYARSEAYPFGKLPSPRSGENRVWQQLVLQHTAGRLQFTHRYRFEQRWQTRRLPSGVDDRVYTNRGRYLARATFPLQGETYDPGEWGVILSNEVFLSWGANVQANVLDQNRTQALIGRRLSRVARLDVGFLEQLVQKPNGREIERNHVVMTILATSF
jgi:hypothetical protein